MLNDFMTHPSDYVFSGFYVDNQEEEEFKESEPIRKAFVNECTLKNLLKNRTMHGLAKHAIEDGVCPDQTVRYVAFYHNQPKMRDLLVPGHGHYREINTHIYFTKRPFLV